MSKDSERQLTLKQIKDSARLLLGMNKLVLGADIGIKALVNLLAATASVTKEQHV